MQNLRKNVGRCNIEGVNSYFTGRAFRKLFIGEPVMSDKKKHEKSPPKPDTKGEKKTSETVHLSAEELRKISGGAAAPKGPNPKPGP